MARPIRSIEIYLPLDYNDGRPIQESKYTLDSAVKHLRIVFQEANWAW